MTPKFTRTTVREKETLGERLAKKRAALGYDIKETERATRIRAKYIELLETGNYEKLPPDVYVRGFLKNYANFLKLDPNKVIGIYAKERGLKENVKKIVEKPVEGPKISRKSEMPKIIVTPKRLIVSGTLLVTFLIISYIVWQVSILAAPPKLEVNNPGDNVKVEEESLIVEGKTDAGSDVFINDIPIGVDPEGTFKEKISIQDGVNLIKITSKNKLNKETQVTRTVLAKLKNLAGTQPVQNVGLEMKLDIGPNSASLYIEVDGKAISEKNAVMLPGSSQIVRAQEKIVITASDGGSVRINLNGKDLGLIGPAGEKIKEKEYTKNSI